MARDAARPQTYALAPLAAVLLLALPATASLLRHGVISGFDLQYHAVTLAQLRECLRDGQWLARWCPDMGGGLGYPVFLFYPPLAYWLALPFATAGASDAAAVQAAMALAILGAAAAMYLMASTRWGTLAGVLAATAYTYTPYHLVTAYVKGAFAELVSFVWLPMIFWALFRLEARASARRAAVVGVFYAALILTNNSSALLFSLVIVPYVAYESVRTRSWKLLRLASAGLVGGALLSAYFWLPAMLEQPFVQITKMTSGYFDFRQHFVSLGELVYSPWNYGGSGFSNQFSRMAGVMTCVFVVAGLFALRRASGRPERVFFLGALALSIVMMLPVSGPLWAGLPLVPFLQFPWKFLAVAGFAGACLSSTLFLLPIGHRAKIGVLAASVAALLALELPHAAPERVLDLPDDFTSPANVRLLTIEDMNQHDFTHYYTSYLPIAVHRVPRFVPTSKLETAPGVTVIGQEIRSDRYDFHIRADQPARLVLNTFWFPGWQATLDGERRAVEPEAETGRLTLSVPPGHHHVVVRLGETPVRFWALVLSSTTLAAGVLIAAWPRPSSVIGTRPITISSWDDDRTRVSGGAPGRRQGAGALHPAHRRRARQRA
ncbi:MAG: 6-pyruvoyl-tetrahydropterin synthase-related protein [Vicinamibacterales bacterium]